MGKMEIKVGSTFLACGLTWIDHPSWTMLGGCLLNSVSVTPNLGSLAGFELAAETHFPYSDTFFFSHLICWFKQMGITSAVWYWARYRMIWYRSSAASRARYSGRDLTWPSLTSVFTIKLTSLLLFLARHLRFLLLKNLRWRLGGCLHTVHHTSRSVLRCPSRFKSSCFSLYHEKWRRRLGATLQDLRQPCSILTTMIIAGAVLGGRRMGTMVEALHDFWKNKMSRKIFSSLPGKQ